ncbi:MAG: hypothetical protein IJU13_01725 [Bacteroidales bacterium]|nr:hypothetical protein [Bacteroidales bacterium]
MKVKTLIIMLLALGFSAGLRAQDTPRPERVEMAQLRACLDRAGSVQIDKNLLLQVLVVSEPGNPNLEQNFQRHYSMVKSIPTDRKAYVESKDGSLGLALDCVSPDVAAKLSRFATVVLSLKGCTLKREDAPVRYTLSEVAEENIVRVYPGSPDRLPYKERRYSQLKDEDLYTYVILKDAEFVLKDGSFADVYETYALKNGLNEAASPNSSMDGWATLLTDQEGSLWYILINSKVPWRRNGVALPQGAGDIGGILVHTPLPRYGGEVLGRYQLRPLFREEIGLDPAPAAANWKTLVEWNWNGGGDLWRPDSGEGSLSCSVKGKCYRGNDVNNTRVEPKNGEAVKGKRGLVSKGALTVKAAARDWWTWPSHEPAYVQIDFSTAGLDGKSLLFGFAFAAGNIEPDTSFGFPVYWTVDYAVDGGAYHPVSSEEFILRSMPWWWGKQVEGINYITSLEAGFGQTQHAILLPQDVVGHAKVSLRLHPSRPNIATLAMEQADNVLIRENIKETTYVNFGSFVIRYK